MLALAYPYKLWREVQAKGWLKKFRVLDVLKTLLTD